MIVEVVILKKDLIQLRKTRLLLAIIPLFYLMITPSIAQAATITGCTFNKAAYSQGETGYLTATINNNEEDKIRVTELTATIDYYYDDGTIYLQTFYSDEAFPIEVLQGQSGNFEIPFSLPNNVAPGYIEVFVKAKTERWQNNSQIWFASEHPTYQPLLYVESPYKAQFEDEQAAGDALEHQVQELQAINATTTNLLYLLGLTTATFVGVTILLVVLNRKTRALSQPSV